MQKRTKTFMLLILGLMSTVVITAFAESHHQPTVYPVTLNGKSYLVTFCPKPSDLVKNSDQLTWSAYHHLWKSYDKSFVNTVKQFIGAQWTGTNVGQVTCLYIGEDALDFPILLRFHTLSITPQGNRWSANLGGFYNCKTHDRWLCPIYVTPKPKSINIIQEAEQLKSPSHHHSDDESP